MSADYDHNPQERIARALERIADALEQAERSGTGWDETEPFRADGQYGSETQSVLGDEFAGEGFDGPMEGSESSSANEQKAESRGTNESSSAEIPTLGHGNDSQLRKTNRQCGASNPEIAGGNQCVLDAGHPGMHESIYGLRLYPWDPS